MGLPVPSDQVLLPPPPVHLPAVGELEPPRPLHRHCGGAGGHLDGAGGGHVGGQEAGTVGHSLPLVHVVVVSGCVQVSGRSVLTGLGAGVVVVVVDVRLSVMDTPVTAGMTDSMDTPVTASMTSCMTPMGADSFVGVVVSVWWVVGRFRSSVGISRSGVARFRCAVGISSRGVVRRCVAAT